MNIQVPSDRSESRTATPLTNEEFASGLALFRERTNLVANIRNWFGQFVEQSISKNTHKQLNVLSVGAGSGHYDLPAIRILMDRKLGQLNYDVLEPNEVLGQLFISNFNASKINNVTLNVQNCFYENFSATKSYDLIHFTNSLSLIENQEQALAKALASLEPGGHLLVTHFTREGYQDLRLQLSKSLNEYKANVLMPEEIDAAFHSLGAKFSFQFVHSQADVTDCFNKESTDGATLFNFLLACNTKCLGDELRNLMLDRMKAICTERDGRLYIPHSVGVHTVSIMN